jgi:hypothetical protein
MSAPKPRRLAAWRHDSVFAALLQFVSLSTLAIPLFSYSLYGLPPISITPYHYLVDAGFAEATQIGSLLALDSSSVDSIIGLLVIMVITSVLVVGFWLYALIRGRVRENLSGLLLGLAVPNFVLLVWVIERFELVKPHPGPFLLLILGPKLALLWFALRGKVLSITTGFFFALSALAALALSGGGIDFPTQWLAPAVTFFLVVGFIRLLRLIIWENTYFLRQIGRWTSVKIFLRSVCIWLPMLLLPAPYFMAKHEVERAVLEGSRTERIEGLVNSARAKELERRGNSDAKLPPPALREWVIMRVAVQFREGLNDFNAEIARTRGELTELQNIRFEKLVMDKFNSALPERIDFPPANASGWFKGLKNFAINTSQDTFNYGYTRIRAQVAGVVREDARATEKEFQSKLLDARSALDQFQSNVEYRVSAASKDAQLATWTLFAYGQALHVLSVAVFAFICVKSFLYVYSRVAFHRGSGSFLTLGETETPPLAMDADITHHAGKLVISRSEPAVYFFSRRYQGLGRPPKFALPQPFGAPIARLCHGATAMNRVTFTGAADEGPVSYSARQGAHFVVWKLREREQVIFDFRHFVGMEATVRVSTLISPRVSSLLLGKMIFSTATGPGELILNTEGRAEVTGREGAGLSLPPDRLVAMHRHARLHADSELGMIDVYFSDAYVRPLHGAPVIVDADRQTGGGSGLGRFLHHFILPG